MESYKLFTNNGKVIIINNFNGDIFKDFFSKYNHTLDKIVSIKEYFSLFPEEKKYIYFYRLNISQHIRCYFEKYSGIEDVVYLYNFEDVEIPDLEFYNLFSLDFLAKNNYAKVFVPLNLVSSAIRFLDNWCVPNRLKKILGDLNMKNLLKGNIVGDKLYILRKDPNDFFQKTYKIDYLEWRNKECNSFEEEFLHIKDLYIYDAMLKNLTFKITPFNDYSFIREFEKIEGQNNSKTIKFLYTFIEKKELKNDKISHLVEAKFRACSLYPKLRLTKPKINTYLGPIVLDKYVFIFGLNNKYRIKSKQTPLDEIFKITDIFDIIFLEDIDAKYIIGRI